MRRRRKLTPKERRLRAIRSRRRLPRIKAGTVSLYLFEGRPVKVRVVRQTATGRVTIKGAGGKLRSVLPTSLGRRK